MAKVVKDEELIEKLETKATDEFPLKLSSVEKTIEQRVYAPIKTEDTDKECRHCNTNMLLVTYKNNFGKIAKLYDCPKCGHME